MSRLTSLLVLLVVGISGCGGDSPTRPNDLTPLTSIEIVVPSSGIVLNTSTQLQAIGHFSGLFARDITDQVVWTSDEVTASFAFPTLPGRIRGLSPAISTISAGIAGGPSASAELTVIDATLTGLAVAPVDPTLAKGLTQTFTASGHFDDGTALGIDRDISFDVAWSSSDPAVAPISDVAVTKGLAQGLAVGNATITAAPAWSTLTGTSQLTVADATLQTIAITPADGAILSLTNRSFTATGSFSDGSSQNLTSQVTWSSSNAAVATIDASGQGTGRVEGATSIRATLAGVTGSTPLLVRGGSLTSIAITPANPTLALGTTRRLTAIGTFSNGTQRDITRVVTWSILPAGNPPLATISNAEDESGRLTANAIGTGTIRATFSSLTAETSLATHGEALTSLVITPPPTQVLLAGTSLPLQVIGTYNNQPDQDLTEDVTWTSSNESVATVDSVVITKGTLRARTAGTANLTASLGTVTSPLVAFTVSPANLLGLAITPVNPTVGSGGGGVQLTATADFGAAGTRDVTRDTTWSVDDVNLAIQAHRSFHPGLFYGVTAGTATLEAQFNGQQAPSVFLTVQ